MHYIKSKRDKTSICNLCRQERSLSWDHVPPKGGIELMPVEMKNIFDSMVSNHESQRQFVSQNGMKYRTICRDCNSYLGQNYDPTLNYFARSVGLYLKTYLSLPHKVSHRVKPQRLMKALLGHLMAAKVSVENTHFDQIAREYVLDPHMKLPKEISVFYWIYPYSTSVAIRDFAMPIPRGSFQDFAIFQTLKYFPVSYLCSSSSEYADLPLLSQYRDCQLDDEVEIVVDLGRVEDEFWPESPSDNDSNFMAIGLSGKSAIYANPKKTKENN